MSDNVTRNSDFSSSPFFDDFYTPSGGDSTRRSWNLRKVLFRPGRAVQTRELNTLQTFITDQMDVLGGRLFEDGELVHGSGISIDNTLHTLRVETDFISAPINLESFVGQTITSGQSRAVVLGYLENGPLGQDPFHIFLVRYLTATEFGDNSSISVNGVGRAITSSIQGNSLVSDASRRCIAAVVGDSVFYASGFYNYFEKSYAILFDDTDSPTVDREVELTFGFNVHEDIVVSDDTDLEIDGVIVGSTLGDNATGSSNERAPGASRYRHYLSLTVVDEATYPNNFIPLYKTSIQNVSGTQKQNTKSGFEVSSGFELEVKNYNGFRVTINGTNLTPVFGEIPEFAFESGDQVEIGRTKQAGTLSSTGGTNEISGTGVTLSGFITGDVFHVAGKTYSVSSVSGSTIYTDEPVEKFTNAEWYRAGLTFTGTRIAGSNTISLNTNPSILGETVVYFPSSKIISVGSGSSVLSGKTVSFTDKTIPWRSESTESEQITETLTVDSGDYFLIDATPISGANPYGQDIAQLKIDDKVQLTTIPLVVSGSVDLPTSTMYGYSRIAEGYVQSIVKDPDSDHYRVYLYAVDKQGVYETSPLNVSLSSDRTSVTVSNPNSENFLLDALVGVDITFGRTIDSAGSPQDTPSRNAGVIRRVVSAAQVGNTLQLSVDRPFPYPLEPGVEHTVRFLKTMNHVQAITNLQDTGGSVDSGALVVRYVEPESSSRFLVKLSRTPKNGTGFALNYETQIDLGTPSSSTGSSTLTVPVNNPLTSENTDSIDHLNENFSVFVQTQSANGAATGTSVFPSEYASGVLSYLDEATTVSVFAKATRNISSLIPNSKQARQPIVSRDFNINYDTKTVTIDRSDIKVHAIFELTAVSTATSLQDAFGSENHVLATQDFVVETGQTDKVVGYTRLTHTGSSDQNRTFQVWYSSYGEVTGQPFTRESYPDKTDIPQFMDRGIPVSLDSFIDFRPRIAADGSIIKSENLPLPGGKIEVTYDALIERRDVVELTQDGAEVVPGMKDGVEEYTPNPVLGAVVQPTKKLLGGSVSVSKKGLRPESEQVTLDFDGAAGNPSIAKTGNSWTLPYSSTAFLQQGFYGKTLRVNEGKSQWIGSLSVLDDNILTKDSNYSSEYDRWENGFVTPSPVQFAAEGLKPLQDYNVFVSGISVDHTFVGATRFVINQNVLTSPVVPLVGDILRQGGNRTTDPNAPEALVISVQNTSATTTTVWLYVNQGSFVGGGTTATNIYRNGDFVQSAQAIPPAAVSIGLASTLTADLNGSIFGSIQLPEGVVRSEATILVTDNHDTKSQLSFAEKTITSSLRFEDVLTRTELGSSAIAESDEDRLNETISWNRPLTQKFFVDEGRNPNGVFIESIDLFFSSKDTNLPVKVSLREVDVNGMPFIGSVVVEKVVQSNDVVSTSLPEITGNGTETKIDFGRPVYLAPGKNYAICVVSDSPNYAIHSADSLERVLPASPVRRPAWDKNFTGLFLPNNYGDWKESKSLSLMMNVNRCEFNLLAPPSRTITFTPDFGIGVDQFILGLKQQQPSNTNLYVYALNNGIRSLVTEGELQNFESRRTSQTFVVEFISTDSKVSPIYDAKSSKIVGVRNLINNAEITLDRIVKPYVGLAGGGTLSGTYTFQILGRPYGRGSSIQITTDTVDTITGQTLVSGGSRYIADVYYENINAVPSNALGQYSVNTELDPSGGTIMSKVISDYVITRENVNKITVKVRAIKPEEVEIFSYIREGEVFESLDSKRWSLMTQSSQNKNKSSDKEPVEYSFTFDVPQTTRNYQIKIGFITSDTTKVPTVESIVSTHTDGSVEASVNMFELTQ